MTHWSQIDANGKVCEFVKVSRENKRLRDGIAAVLTQITDDYAADDLAALLNPPQEEHDEFANITGDEAMRYGWTV